MPLNSIQDVLQNRHSDIAKQASFGVIHQRICWVGKRVVVASSVHAFEDASSASQN